MFEIQLHCLRDWGRGRRSCDLVGSLASGQLCQVHEEGSSGPHLSFHLNPSQTAYLGTLIIPLQILITQARGLCPRTLYFRYAKLHVGLTAVIQNEF
jgi:hypothetical protein